MTGIPPLLALMEVNEKVSSPITPQELTNLVQDEDENSRRSHWESSLYREPFTRLDLQGWSYLRSCPQQALTHLEFQQWEKKYTSQMLTHGATILEEG